MKPSPDKLQFIILGNKDSHTLQIGDITTNSTSSVTLLGVTIDSKFNFKEHINKIIKKSIYKLYALRKPRKFLA